MKYITILETSGNSVCNIGTVSTFNTEESFRQAIETHFDCRMIKMEFDNKNTKSIKDCIDANSVNITVTLEEDTTAFIQVSETWLY